MSLGYFLKHFREERGLSLRELATLSDINHAYIHRLEQGEKEYPSQQTLKALIAALKLDTQRADMLRNYAVPIPDAWEALLRAARRVVNHWNEFGPEYDFGDTMDDLEQAMQPLTGRGLDVTQQARRAGLPVVRPGENAGAPCEGNAS